MSNHTISKCRVSGNKNLVKILSLGQQALTGIFPKDKSVAVESGPLDLLWCPESGLVQLANSYSKEAMYGENYGYRSGLNMSMVRHLHSKIKILEKQYQLKIGDVVLDIGSNDGTTLKGYSTVGLKKIGIDPTSAKFRKYYDSDVTIVEDFFSPANFKSTGAGNANLVTSIAMFYDLESPIDFAKNVEEILAPDGIWHFEQSYLPLMLRNDAYDTVCHEHISYYSLSVVKRILDAANLRIIDVGTNDINGGSFAVTASKKSSKWKSNDAVINWMIDREQTLGLHTPKPYREFEERAFQHKKDLKDLLRSLVSSGKTVIGYGASTKGNVILQFCGITAEEIPAIAEVNPDKFGCVTPGTNIPIISEAEAKERYKPDYFLVLPWHFRENIISREREFLDQGGKLIFPLPNIEIVSV